MLKFLRKYKAIIMVVGGSLLMVVFLLPQAASQFGQFDPTTQTVARYGGKKVTGGMLYASNRERGIVKAIVPALFDEQLQVLPGDDHHWYLLTKEAERAGLVGGPSDSTVVEEWGKQYEALWEVQRKYPGYVNDQTLMPQLLSNELGLAGDRVANRRASLRASGQTEQSIGNAMAKAAGIKRLLERYDISGMVSKPEAIDLASRVHDVVIVQAGIFGVESAEEFITKPTEEEMVEHFEAYKETRAAEDLLGIGYMRPMALRLEWMTVSRSAVEAGLTLDPIEVNKYWRQARAENPDLYPADFAAARERVEVALRRQKAQEAMDAVDQVVRREVQDARRGLASDGIFKVLGEDWAERRADLFDIATVVDTELASRFGVGGAMPEVTQSDGVFRSYPELQQLGGVGSAQYLLGGTNEQPFISILMNARELGGDERLGIQEGLLYGPGYLGGPNGNRVYVRILETRKESPPGSMLEVRERVLEDIRLVRSMAYYDEHQAEIVEVMGVEHTQQLLQPITKGVEWVGVEVTRDQVVRSQFGARQLEARLNTEDFRDAIHRVIERWDTKARPEILYHPAERTIGLVMNEARGLVVAQIRTRRPMTLEQYRESGNTVQQIAGNLFVRERQDSPFTFERLQERLDYVVIGGDDDESESAEEGAVDEEVAAAEDDSAG